MNDEERLLSAGEADKLLASADGTAALLYLHILRQGGFSLTAAARALRCKETEIARAAETLRRLGLLRAPEEPLRPEEFGVIRSEDIVARADTDSAFQGVVAEAERALGRVLSAHDLEVLFGIYDQLGLPADVMLLLLNHCVEECQARSGPGRKPAMRYIEKEAWFWAKEELMSIDAAEAHLQRCRQRRETAAQVQDAMQIRGRELTATERKYVDGWLALGFGPEAIAIAYDRTMARTGRMAWKYMDTILRSWSDKGLMTPEAIEAEDPMQRSKRTAASAAPEDSKKQIEDLRKLYDSINRRKEG